MLAMEEGNIIIKYKIVRPGSYGSYGRVHVYDMKKLSKCEFM